MVEMPEAKNTSLIGGGFVSFYLLLKDGADYHQLEAKFPAFVEKHVAPQLSAALQGQFTMEKFRAQGNEWL
jgi:putative ABC transport system permease protein